MVGYLQLIVPVGLSFKKQKQTYIFERFELLVLYAQVVVGHFEFFYQRRVFLLELKASLLGPPETGDAVFKLVIVLSPFLDFLAAQVDDFLQPVILSQ